MLRLLINLMTGVKLTVRKRWFVMMFFLFALFAYSTAGYMYFELPEKPNLTWLDSAWWSVVTMTTVGYGDYFPVTYYGRVLVGFPTMLLGVGVLGYLLSSVASAIVESKIRELKGLKQMHYSDHIIITRYNSLGSTLKLINELKKDKLTKNSVIVVVDDDLDELPDELVSIGIKFVKGDASRETALQKANYESAKWMIIPAIENDTENSDHRNLATALTIERLKPEIYTVVQVVNPENEIFFKRAGVDSIVNLSSLSSQMIVQELQDPGVNSVIFELTSNSFGKQFYIVDIKGEYKTYEDLKKYYNQKGVAVGIRRDTQNIMLPSPDTEIKTGDKVIMIAENRPD